MIFETTYQLNEKELRKLPVVLSLMQLKTSPPTIIRIVLENRTQFEIAVKPFYKPISKMHDDKK